VLLIDLENFFLARETTAESDTHEPYDLIRDLEHLRRFASELVGDERRLIVRRAYADFGASRLDDGAERPRREYFLRSAPTMLMDQGIEPVQVFRFPGGGRGASKNAADMRLAMDAVSLISTADFFILVTGDKDFIPVVLELRQRGAYVVGLGAHGSIGRTLTAYCDEFHEFEELVAAHESMLDERGSDELARGEVATVVAPAGPRPHTLGLYRRLLLSSGTLRLHIHDVRVWTAVTDHVFETATNPDGTPAVVFHHELRSAVIDHFADEGLQDTGKVTSDALFLIFKAGCFVCAQPGPRFGQADFNWTNHSARLAPDIDSPHELRRRAHAFTVEQLAERLREHDGRRPEPELVALLLFGPDPGDEELALTHELVAGPGAAEPSDVSSVG